MTEISHSRRNRLKPADLQRLYLFGWLALASISIGWIGWVSSNVIGNGNSHVQHRTQYDHISRDIGELKQLVQMQIDAKTEDRIHRHEVTLWHDRLSGWRDEITRRNPSIDLPEIPAIPRLID